MLRGLNERYCDIGIHLRRAHSFPSFAAVRNELLLEEINMDHAPADPPAALVTTGSSVRRPPAPSSGSPPRTDAPKQKEKKPKAHRSSGTPAAPGVGAPSDGGSSISAAPGPGTP